MQEFIEKLIGRLEELEKKLLDKNTGFECTMGIVNFMEHTRRIVNQLAEEYNNESVKGKWINTAPSSRSDNIVCSECGYNSIADYPFCPNCGRRMKEGVKAKACNDGWIPCSERLPEEGKAIRVWLSFTNPVASFAKRAWWNDNHFEWDNGQRVKDKPLAWMVSVAPEPYQPKGE